MKKILRISFWFLGIVIILLIASILIVPVLFKGQILTAVKTEINKNLKARVEFSDFSLSLIRHFPNLSFRLDELSVVGTGVFEGDTLAGFRSFGATVNLFPLITGDGIQIRSVLLDRPVILARSLADGSVNWDIMLPAEEEEITEEPDTAAMEIPSLEVKLQKFEIRQGRIGYYDESSMLLASLEPVDFVLSGDMTKELTSLQMNLTVGATDVEMDGIRYLNRARLSFRAGIAADLDQMQFTLEDNELSLNEIVLGLEGTVAMTETAYPVDLKFNARQTSFKSLLSMVPAMYTQDFEGLETSGSLSLEGTATGAYSSADSTLPDIRMSLQVQNAMFKYPDLPRQVDQVNINTHVFVDGKDLDGTTVDVDQFSFRIGENPFSATFHLRTPISDPEMSGQVNGRIDLGTLADVVPLEDTRMKGILDAALTLGGRMSWLEKEEYERFTADGSLRLENFEFSAPDLPVPVNMPVAELLFSPRYVEVPRLDLNLGESDLHFTGRMENFIPYVFQEGETVRGRFDLSSNLLDVNQLMPESTEEPVEENADTLALSVIEVPPFVDIEFTSELKKILYANMEISNLQGRILVRDRKVMLDQLLLDLLGGNAGLTGEYNTQDMENPRISMDMNARDISIPAAYQSFVTIQKLAPLAEGLNGDMSLALRYNSLLGSDLMPALPSVNGGGSLRSDEVSLVSSETFDKIRSALKLKSDLTNRFKDINIKFRIVDGNLLVDPFEARMGDIRMVIGGRQGLDQSMDFLVKMAIPRNAFGEGANQVVDNLVSTAASKGLAIQPGETVNVDVRITGTVSDPKISLDLKESMQNAMQEARQQVEKKVEEVIQEKKEEVTQKIEEKTDEVKEDARQRAEQMIAAAEKARDDAMEKAAAEKDKAYAEAARIEKDAKGNMVEQLKAKAKAETIRKTADAAYNKAKELAENEYQKALDRANEELEKK